MTEAPFGIDADVVVADTDAISREEWLELRRQGIGGSDAAACLGLSPYGSPVSVFYDKTDPRPDTDRDIFKAGRIMEEPIARWFAEDNGEVTVTRVPVMLRSREHPFQIANVDRFTHPLADLNEGVRILEVKNVDRSKADQWREGPPLHARVQVQHYLSVTGLDGAYVAACIGGNRLVWFHVASDEELIASLIAREEAIWTMIQMGRVPDIDGSEATRDALRRHFGQAKEGETVEVDERFMALVELRRGRKEMLAHAEELMREVDSKLIAAIGDAELAYYDDAIVATYKSQTRREHTVKESTFRVLRVKEG